MATQLTDTVAKLIRVFGDGMTLRQLAIMSAVGDKPELSTLNYAVTLKLNKPTITRAVQKMVAKGWLENEKSSSDARSRVIKLTKAGEKLLQKVVL